MTDTALKPTLEPLRKSETEPTWLQIKNLFEKYGCAPPTALRDEVATLAMWAWYGKNLDAAVSAHPHPVEMVQADVQPVAIQRYEFDGGSVWCGEAASMTPHVSGDYVLFTDHQATVAALEAYLEQKSHLIQAARADRKIYRERAEQAEASFAEMQKSRDDWKEISDLQVGELAKCQREKEGLREQNDWLKDRLAFLQLPATRHDQREEWLSELGMPALKSEGA
ncbi:hypothetical protein BFS86_19730 [Shewanella algae]|nr:hypothetical protein BFS86_19730 [Shewanella algae]